MSKKKNVFSKKGERKKFVSIWGTLEYSANEHDKLSFYDTSWVNGELNSLLLQGRIVEQHGRFGMVTPYGKQIFPCIFNKIEKTKYFLYLEKGKYYYCIRYECGYPTEGDTTEKSDFFVENGKLGWRENGKILFPALYDQIIKWKDVDVYAMEKDGEWGYLNHNGRTILTSHQRFEGEGSEKPPFSINADDRTIITLQEYVGQEVKEDTNVINIRGEWVRLSRLQKSKLMELLVNPLDELPINEEDLERFDNEYSYNINVYTATSSKKDAIMDCMEKIRKMAADPSSLYYVVKVWMAPGEEPSAEILRRLRYYIEDMDKWGEGLVFSLAHDDTLDAGETRLLTMTYKVEFFSESNVADLLDVFNTCTLEELLPIIKRYEECYCQATSFSKSFWNTIWKEFMNRLVTGIIYHPDRSWQETVRVLEYFKKRFGICSCFLNEAVRQYRIWLDISSFDEDKIQHQDFKLRVIKWLVENGAHLNFIKYRKTPLDQLRDKDCLYADKRVTEDLENEKKKNDCALYLIEHGAKGLEELRKAESLNDDYKVELLRMNS